MKLTEEAREAEVTMTLGEFQDAIKGAVSHAMTAVLDGMAEQILEAEREDGVTFRSGAEVAEFLGKMAKHASDPTLWKDKM
jgi:hypothetical protein